MTGRERRRDHALWRELAPDAYETLGLPPQKLKAARDAQARTITKAYAKAPLKALPAAIIDPRVHGPEVIRNSPRVIPEAAKRIMVGNCTIGYKHKGAPLKPIRISALRKCEIERLIQLRYGGPCDCDDGAVYFYIVANSIALSTLCANANRHDPISSVKTLLRGWAANWVPRVAANEIDYAVAQAIAKPRWWRADTAATLLHLTMAERAAAHITTIGATDCDKTEGLSNGSSGSEIVSGRGMRPSGAKKAPCRDRNTFPNR